MGATRFQPGGCCGCASPTTFCAYLCGATPAAGAIITVGSYSPCTASSAGCCSINGITAGTYPVTVVLGGTTIYSQSLSITPGHSYALQTSCCIKVCLTCCDGSAYPYGATVEVRNASTGATVASGTSDPTTGCVTISLATSDLNPGAPSATIAVTPNCSLYASYSATYNPACGQTIDITLQAADATAVCCSNQHSCVPIKASLTITDANGSWPFVKQGGGGWYACYLTNASPTYPASYNNTLGQCIVDTSKTGTYPTRIEYYGAPASCYIAGCGAPAAGTFAVTRVWYLNSTSPNIYHAATPGPNDPCDSCSAAGAAHTDCSFGTASMPTGCSPFAVSIGSLAPNAGNFLPDPVGGGVAIS